MENSDNKGVEIEKTCRLCKHNMVFNGVVSNTRLLFSSLLNKSREKPISERFRDIGVVLPCRPGLYSSRICKACLNALTRVEGSLGTLDRWKREHNNVVVEETPNDGGERRSREEEKTKRGRDTDTPTESPPRPKKLLKSLNPETRVSTTEVYINYPSKTAPEKYTCNPAISGVINNLAKSKFTTAAKLMVQHAGLMDALKPVMGDVIDKECQSLCHRSEGFMLWKTSPEELKKFSLHNLQEDLEKMAPFMFSVICTVSGMQTNHACAAAAIALRGRETHLSAFAYHINSVLQYGGAKKAVFECLSRMGITTTHANAVRKRHAMSALCGEDLQKLKAKSETPATAQESIEESITASFQGQSESEMDSFQSPLSESEISMLSESEISSLE